MFVYTLLNDQYDLMFHIVILSSVTSCIKQILQLNTLRVLTKSNISGYMLNRTRNNLMKTPLVNTDRRFSKVGVRVLGDEEDLLFAPAHST